MKKFIEFFKTVNWRIPLAVLLSSFVTRVIDGKPLYECFLLGIMLGFFALMFHILFKE
jgi:hypothetical protein